MIRKIVAWYMERILYKLPQNDDPKLFCSEYTDEQKTLVMQMLRSLLHETNPNEFSNTVFNAIGRKIFKIDLNAIGVNPVAIQENCAAFNKEQKFDIEMLAVLLH